MLVCEVDKGKIIDMYNNLNIKWVNFRFSKFRVSNFEFDELVKIFP